MTISKVRRVRSPPAGPPSSTYGRGLITPLVFEPPHGREHLRIFLCLFSYFTSVLVVFIGYSLALLFVPLSRPIASWYAWSQLGSGVGISWLALSSHSGCLFSRFYPTDSFFHASWSELLSVNECGDTSNHQYFWSRGDWNLRSVYPIRCIPSSISNSCARRHGYRK